MFDAHFHLEFIEDKASFLQEADMVGLQSFCVSCRPHKGKELQELISDLGLVAHFFSGIGLHPWEIAKLDEKQIEQELHLFEGQQLIGEVGLDFSEKHCPKESFELQVKTFEKIGDIVSAHQQQVSSQPIFSIHAVQSANYVLDILEEKNIGTLSPIFHWFSGSGDELIRARKLGCYFSINQFMLKTRRGKAYVQQIPLDQMLLETDLPEEGTKFTVCEWKDALDTTLTQIAELKGIEKEELQDLLSANHKKLFLNS